MAIEATEKITVDVSEMKEDYRKELAKKIAKNLKKNLKKAKAQQKMFSKNYFIEFKQKMFLQRCSGKIKIKILDEDKQNQKVTVMLDGKGSAVMSCLGALMGLILLLLGVVPGLIFFFMIRIDEDVKNSFARELSNAMKKTKTVLEGG